MPNTATQMRERRGLRADHIAVHPMPAGGWRIVDKRVSSIGMESVIGFVARRGDLFEVVRISHPFSRSYCETLDEVAGLVLRPHAYHPWIAHFEPAIVPDAVKIPVTEKALVAA